MNFFFKFRYTEWSCLSTISLITILNTYNYYTNILIKYLFEIILLKFSKINIYFRI